MQLTTKTKRELKAKAHSLRPVILIGNKGVTAAVLKEIDQALNDHELIKIRLQSDDKKERRQMLQSIAESLQAADVQVIGNIGVLYRKSNKT